MNQYYNTVGYQQPEYAVTGSHGSNMSALQQNLKTDSMNSFGTGQTSPEEPALLEAAGAGAAGAGDYTITSANMRSHLQICCNVWTSGASQK